MFCQRCGTQVGSDVQFCPNCGQAQGGAPLSGSASTLTPWTPPAGVHASAGRWIGEGWALVKADLGNYIVISLLFAILSGVPLIQGPLVAGFHIFTMKKLLGRNAEFGDLFKGFNFFVPTLVASLLIGVFTFAGTLLCIIPGLVVAAMYKFTYLFIVDKKMDFWPAMQASHAVVKNDYFGFTLFLILAFLVNILGVLVLHCGTAGDDPDHLRGHHRGLQRDRRIRTTDGGFAVMTARITYPRVAAALAVFVALWCFTPAADPAFGYADSTGSPAWTARFAGSRAGYSLSPRDTGARRSISTLSARWVLRCYSR